MCDINLGHAREGFYRRFVVCAAPGVAHLAVLVISLALALAGQMHATAVILFFLGNAVVAASFLPAWRRVAIEHPEAVRAVEAEGDNRIETTALNENRPLAQGLPRHRRVG